MKRLPPVDVLRANIAYDPETGAMMWRQGRQGRNADLTIAAFSKATGYGRVHLDGETYEAHRIAFVLARGREPQGEVDHIDGDPRNNSANNLREATRQENARNRRSRGYTRHPKRKENPYQARIKVGGKIISLGCFPTAELAQAAYQQAREQHFGEFNGSALLGAARALRGLDRTRNQRRRR